MRIDKITINNFRIYHGRHELAFKVHDSKRNISIIAGQNGFGKTTFLTALVWGFYGKLIGEVDEKYKREIYEAGGYKKYANAILNRDIKTKASLKQNFGVKIEISELYIPSVPCSKMTITREYDAITEQEETKILIDGFENGLTKEVGSDIFINDFILPREIAKFFLFDAEKIVSLAEIKTIGEKRKLSKAYSEVLGINKYETLKNNLENLRVKLRKKSATLVDKERLDKLISESKQLEELIQINEKKISTNDFEIDRNRILSEQFQEKLIREGNSMSVEAMVSQKKLRDTLRTQSIEIKAKLKDLLELAPFAIAGGKLKQLYAQVKNEASVKQKQANNLFVKEKFKKIKQKVESQIQQKTYTDKLKAELFDIVTSAFEENIQEQNTTLNKVLLDLTSEQTNEFESLYDNIGKSYNILFTQIVKEEKNNRIFLMKTLKKISNAEAKDTDVLAKKYKEEKTIIDKKIKEINVEQTKLYEELGVYKQELSSKSRVISELAKTVDLDKIDAEKDKVTERLINELTDFTYKFKVEKVKSLEKRIKSELLRLMHKIDFIESVKVKLTEEIIDIYLYSKDGNLIEKETLSKGEQQLYATALLKSLVDESGIKFPIFIDSPLQKFDRKHSTNIITEFYPSISKQVILFPLLEKELTEKEYSMLIPYTAQTFIIQNMEGKSGIKETNPTKLFNEIEKHNVHTY